MGSEHGIVWLNDGGRDLWCRVDGKLELGLLCKVGSDSLEEESTETGTSTTSKGVEDKETLQAGALVCDTTQLVLAGLC